jgi:GMP synthase-like glutamine amidotransferase
LKLFMAHQDQVTHLPPGGLWLADAPHCAHAAFSLDDCVLGLQPHPEFSAGFMCDMTLEETFALPPAQRAHALASYTAPVDNGVVGPWIADFLGLLSPVRRSAWARWHTTGAQD